MQNNSNERYVREKLSTDIDAIISGKYNQNDDVMIRKNTPTILVEHGIKNLRSELETSCKSAWNKIKDKDDVENAARVFCG